MTSRFQKDLVPKIAENIIFYPIKRIQYSSTCPLLNLRRFYPKVRLLNAKRRQIRMKKIIIVIKTARDWMFENEAILIFLT